MADPTPRKIYRWLWPVVIAALAILTVIWWFSPTGEVPEPAPEAGTGLTGEGLPGEDAPDPAGDEPVPDDGEASAERLPAETVEVPAQAVPLPPPER